MLEWANRCVALSALLVVLSDPVKGLPAVPACRSTGAISMSSQFDQAVVCSPTKGGQRALWRVPSGLRPNAIKVRSVLFDRFGWSERGSGPLTCPKRPEQGPNRFRAQRSFRFNFRICLLKGMVPLTGFEPVIPSLRMELRKSVKPFYYNALS